MSARVTLWIASDRAGMRVSGRGWIAGVTVGRDFLRPCAERWPGYAFAEALGVALWIDRRPRLTVGERGVW